MIDISMYVGSEWTWTCFRFLAAILMPTGCMQYQLQFVRLIRYALFKITIIGIGYEVHTRNSYYIVFCCCSIHCYVYFAQLRSSNRFVADRVVVTEEWPVKNIECNTERKSGYEYQSQKEFVQGSSVTNDRPKASHSIVSLIRHSFLKCFRLCQFGLLSELWLLLQLQKHHLWIHTHDTRRIKTQMTVTMVNHYF